jgi:hypothetical protein
MIGVRPEIKDRVGLWPGLCCHLLGSCRLVAWTAAQAIMDVSACGMECGTSYNGRVSMWHGMRRFLQLCQLMALTALPSLYHVSACSLDCGCFLA